MAFAQEDEAVGLLLKAAHHLLLQEATQDIMMLCLKVFNILEMNKIK